MVQRRLWGRRQVWRGLVIAVLVVASFAALPASAAAQSQPFQNPCDVIPGLPFCTSALGPLRDITANWHDYQPALVQPIPIADYFPGDFEDDPVTGAGFCGTEKYNPPPPAPVSTVETGLQGYPPPPRNLSGPTTYCFLRYLPADFDPLCQGCHRILIDYSAIPATGPPAQGHWAGHMFVGSYLQPLMPFNAHSPNVKNLCSDKSINPTPGAGCADPLGSFDSHLHSIEGDTTYYHHFPGEGRYFNGPAYMAGDGAGVPYHWVTGAYFDVSPNGGEVSPVWYGAGYRGAGDALPDTDLSYGCLCEVPPAGHGTVSADLVLGADSGGAPAVGGPPAGGGSNSGAGVLSAGTGTAGATINGGGGLPNTGTGGPATAPWLIATLLVVLTGAVARRLASKRR